MVSDLLEEKEELLREAEQLKQRIVELEKENAELDCQKNRNKACYSCANATERCFKNEIGCPCEKYKSYKDENAQLKNRNSELAGQKASLERWYGEAKELIVELISSLSVVGECEEEECELLNRAEQFLKENEVEK